MAVQAAAATPSQPAPLVTTLITPELRASLVRDYTIDVVVTPHAGDAWTRLAKRVTGDASKWKAIADANGGKANLTTEQRVHVPLALLRAELQRQILKSLFPSDRMTDSGWRHIVAGGSGVEGESLWNIAQWFTGNGANYPAVRKANPGQGLSTHAGDVIVVPTPLLTAAFGGSSEGQNAPTPATEIRKPEDDPVERTSEDAHVPVAAVEAATGLVASLTPSLDYVRGAPEPFAVYRLQRGEALYSSVAIRFTGRVYAKDVGDVLDRIVKFNGIEDVAKIRVGYPVKIPLSLLLPEYLPPDDPQRVAREEQQRESAKLARRTRARGLSGVRVVLDAGHGGRDVGTEHDGVFESAYVYDVMCRLKQIIEKRSAATVATTTKSNESGYSVVNADALDDAPNDQAVLTTPRYELGDPVIGVHLRWYLANSIFRRAMKQGMARQKVVFVSLHADSLHPSLRGAMVYIPGQRYVQGSFQKSEKVYLARAEVRERPVVTHSEEESLEAEGLSRDLAESIIDSFENAGLGVHPFNPVRDNVVRNGREWVPAVIRYNVVPTRALIEICNLGNQRDRDLMQTKKYRQQVAQAIYDGIVAFYAGREAPAEHAVAAGR
jgi:N-acetylmuramoyl-L-alanine amidase